MWAAPVVVISPFRVINLFYDVVYVEVVEVEVVYLCYKSSVYTDMNILEVVLTSLAATTFDIKVEAKKASFREVIYNVEPDLGRWDI